MADSTTPTLPLVNPNSAFQTTQAPNTPQGTPLQPTTAPTSAANVTLASPVTIPSTTSTTVDTNGVNGMVSYYTSLFNTANQKANDALTAENTAKEQQAQQTQPFLSKIMSSLSPSQVQDQAQTTTGIDPASYFADEKAQIAQIDTLNQQYNTMVANRDQQIADLTGQGRGIPVDLLNNQAAQITKNAAPALNALSADINSKSATLQASQGLFTEAQNYVQKAVDASTADLQYNVQMYTTFYNQNQSIIDNLDSTYQNALKDATTDAQTALTTAQNDKTAVGALMINPDYLGAGITLNDTLEQAQTKAAAWAQTHPSLDTQVKESTINANNNKAVGTAAERSDTATANFSAAFVPGATLPNGIPVLDSDGYMTPEAWQSAIADAPSEGLSRADFIKNFGHFIYAGGQISPKYGLTPEEEKTVTGTL